MHQDTAVSVVTVDGRGLHGGSGAPEVKATYAESLSTTLKAIVGSGITALPFAFKEAGWMAASIGLTCIALASAYTMRQVIVCVQLLRARIDAAQDWQRMESDNLGYSQLGAELFGRAGRIWVDAVLISCQVGSSCAFVVFVADCIHSVLPVSVASWLHVSLLIALLFPLLCALALPRNTTYLAPTSHLGNISLVVGVTTVMVYGFRNQTVSFDNTIEYRGVSGLATFFGICVFTFSAHAEVTSIEQFADDRPAYRQIVVLSVLASGAIYFAFGLLCYMFFGEATDSIIFLNLPPASAFVSVVKCALAFVVLSNYPLAMFPATEALDILLVPLDTVPAPGGGSASLDDDEPFPAPLLPADLAGSSAGASGPHAHASANGASGATANGSGVSGVSGGGAVSVAADETTPLNPAPGRLRVGFNRRKGNAMRICAVAFTCLVAALLPNFGYITALVGSVSNGMLAFVLPPVFYLQLHRLPPPRTVGPVAYTPPRIGAWEYGFNVLLAVVGTIATLGSGALIAYYGTGAP